VKYCFRNCAYDLCATGAALIGSAAAGAGFALLGLCSARMAAGFVACYVAGYAVARVEKRVRACHPS
jgi:hypothetical protein